MISFMKIILEEFRFSIHKIDTKVNCADLGTKNLDRTTILKLAELAGLKMRTDTHSMALKT